MDDIDGMGMEAVRAELAGYTPATAFGVVRSEEHMARRAQLWARLDALLGVRAAPGQR